jgi:hypothetical protein
MGSRHPKGRDAASQEGSANLRKLFKKEGFSCGLEAANKGVKNNVANTE